MFKVLLVLVTLGFVMSGNANATVAVPTNIVNADKAQFVGAIVVANTDTQAINNVKPEADSVVIGFSTMTKCQDFVDSFAVEYRISGTPGSAGQLSALNNTWATKSYAVLVGQCVDK